MGEEINKHQQHKNMSLPDSITLTGNSVNTTYENKTRLGNVVTYYADSANGDLAGRPTLIISQEMTKAGIAKGTVSLVTPVLNALTGKYDSFLKNTFTSTQSGLKAIDDRVTQVGQMKHLLELHGSDLAAGDL